jgi:hypothetical protein
VKRIVLILVCLMLSFAGTNALSASAASDQTAPIGLQESIAQHIIQTTSSSSPSPTPPGTTMHGDRAQTPTPGAVIPGTVADGVTDDTSAIQAAVAALPAGSTIDGGGRTYVVTTITLKSDMTFANFNLITRAGSTDFVSPVTIGSNHSSDLTSDVVVRNVHVDGNRINQTRIGDSEDGGRHGFRIVGHVADLLIENCSAMYCASDGIEIYSGLGGGSFPRAISITVKDSRFNWNRRHGGSGDAISGAQFINVEFNDNGQDLNAGDALDSGGRGARSQGHLYGSGIDMEGYGAGSANTNISFIGVTALRNVRTGILFYDPMGATDSGFRVSSNIVIAGCNVDCGNGTGGDGQPYAIEFTSTPAHKALGPIYANITLSDNLIRGWVSFRAVDGVTISGGEMDNPQGMLGNLDYATNVTVSMNRGNREFYTGNSTVNYLEQSVSTVSANRFDTTSIESLARPAVASAFAPSFVRPVSEVLP